MLRSVAAVLAALLLAAVPAGAKTPPAATVADALATSPVYVAPDADPALDEAQASALAGSSEMQSDGTVMVALLPASVGASEQRIRGYANRVDRALPPGPRTLIVTAGDRVWVVTTADDAAARAAVQQAFDGSGGDVAGALQASVAGVAPLTAPASQPVPGDAFDDAFGDAGQDIMDTITTVFRIGAILAILAFVLPFLLLGGFILVRVRRARAVTAASLEDRCARADGRLLALGEQIRLHDLDVQMPGASAEGVAHYERAIAAYDEANSALTLSRDELTPRTMTRIEHALLRGEHEMAAAARALAAPSRTGL